MITSLSDPVTFDDDVRANRLEWLAALESGKYKQAQGRLKRQEDEGDPGLFCCLGVRCDLVDTTAWKYDRGGDGPMFVYYDYSADTMPPSEITVLFDDSDNENIELASRNDGGWTFRQIAFRYRKDHNLWDGYTAQPGDINFDISKNGDKDEAADTKPVE